MYGVATHQIRLLGIPSTVTLNACRVGPPAAFLGSCAGASPPNGAWPERTAEHPSPPACILSRRRIPNLPLRVLWPFSVAWIENEYCVKKVLVMHLNLWWKYSSMNLMLLLFVSHPCQSMVTVAEFIVILWLKCTNLFFVQLFTFEYFGLCSSSNFDIANVLIIQLLLRLQKAFVGKLPQYNRNNYPNYTIMCFFPYRFLCFCFHISNDKRSLLSLLIALSCY